MNCLFVKLFLGTSHANKLDEFSKRQLTPNPHHSASGKASLRKISFLAIFFILDNIQKFSKVRLSIVVVVATIKYEVMQYSEIQEKS